MRNILYIAILGILSWQLQGCAAGAAGAAGGGTTVVIDRRTTGTLVDDQLIEFKAIDAFHGDKTLWQRSHINVTSYNNIVLLSGEIPEESLKGRAVALVRSIEKVRQVHDETALAAPSSLLARSSDTWITSKLKTSLIHAKAVTAIRVKVVTERGIVYLLGLVSHAEAKTATELARQISGVQRVVKLFEYRD